MVARGGVEMREEYLEQDVGSDAVMIADELLRLEYLLQVVERHDDVVAHGNEEVAAYHKIYLLLRRLVGLLEGRELENDI